MTGACGPGPGGDDPASDAEGSRGDEARWQGQIDDLHASERREQVARATRIYDNDKPTRPARGIAH
jgi:hypothetical protein